MQRSALCRSRRELSNEYSLAKFGFYTAENEPCKVCTLSAYRSPRSALQIEGELGELVIQNCLAEEAIYRQGSVVRTAYMPQGSAFSPRVLVSPAEKGFALTEKEVLGCKYSVRNI